MKTTTDSHNGPRTSADRLTGWALFTERLYRLTHGGRIRTLVLSQDRRTARDLWVGWLEEEPNCARKALKDYLSENHTEEASRFAALIHAGRPWRENRSDDDNGQ